MSESILLKVTSALWIGGTIAKAGEIIEVSYIEAKDLLGRGKAVLADEADAPKVAPRALSVSGTKEDDESESKSETDGDAPAETKSRRKK